MPEETYVYVIVVPDGLEVALALEDPSGNTIKERARFPRGVDPEIYWPLEHPGEYTFEVRGSGPPAAAGSYRLQVVERRQANDRDLEETLAYYRHDEAKLAKEDGDFVGAIEGFSASLATWVKLDKADWIASMLDHIGFCHRQLEDYEAAIEHYQRALPYWRRAEDTKHEISTLINLSVALRHTGRLDDALESAEQALTRSENGGAYAAEQRIRVQQAQALNQLGLVLQDLGRLNGAHTALDRAWKIQHDLGSRVDQAKALINLGTVIFDLGQPEEAGSHHQRALDLLQEVPGRDEDRQIRNFRAAAFSNLAVVNAVAGHFFAALEAYQKALETTPYDAAEADIRRNLGTLYRYLGETRLAADFYRRSYEIHRQLGRSTDAASVLADLAWVQAHAEGPSNVAYKMGVAIEALRRQKNPAYLSMALEKQGQIFLDRAMHAEAREALEEALLLSAKSGDRQRQGRVGVRLAQLYLELGEQTSAQTMLEAVLRTSRATGDLQCEAAAVFGRARLARTRHRFDDARQEIGRALEIFDEVWENAGDPHARATFLALHREAFELAIEVEMELHRRRPEAEHEDAAFKLSERARSRSLLEQMRRSDAPVAGDPELRAAEEALRLRLNSRQHYRFKLAGAVPARPDLVESLDRELAELVRQHRVLKAKLQLAAGPRDAAWVGLDELQRLLDDETVVLAYHLGARRGVLWAITATAVEVAELPPRADIERTIETWRDRLTLPGEQRDREQQQAAERLREILLEPVSALIEGEKRLVIVADGALHAFPFAALPSSATNDGHPRPLIATHEVINLPSATILRLLRQRSRTPAERQLAVIADAVFDASDDRLVPGGEAEPAVTRAFDRNRLGRLKQSAGTARAVAALADPTHTLSAFGFDASRDLFLSGELERYRLLYIATHGRVDRLPELSGLMFSKFTPDGRPVDDFVSLADIAASRFRADLVTLGACETALGEAVRGEGVFSVGRGFLEAGVPRVLATLWPVDDASTAELMKHFHEGLLRHGLSPTAALRRAQLAMIESPGKAKWSRPYHWAPFVLFGDWQ